MKEMLNFIIAQVIGGIALVILIISFQKNSKVNLLKYQMVSSLLYSIQYAFLDALPGCFMNLACMFRNFIFKKYQKVPLYWLLIVVFVMIILSLMTFNGLISLLPMCAVIMYSIAVWYGKLKSIRVVEVFSCLLYIIYNIYVGAYTGLIATIIEMLGAMFAIYKYDLKSVHIIK